MDLNGCWENASVPNHGNGNADASIGREPAKQMDLRKGQSRTARLSTKGGGLALLSGFHQ